MKPEHILAPQIDKDKPELDYIFQQEFTDDEANSICEENDGYKDMLLAMNPTLNPTILDALVLRGSRTKEAVAANPNTNPATLEYLQKRGDYRTLDAWLTNPSVDFSKKIHPRISDHDLRILLKHTELTDETFDLMVNTIKASRDIEILAFALNNATLTEHFFKKMVEELYSNHMFDELLESPLLTAKIIGPYLKELNHYQVGLVLKNSAIHESFREPYKQRDNEFYASALTGTSDIDFLETLPDDDIESFIYDLIENPNTPTKLIRKFIQLESKRKPTKDFFSIQCFYELMKHPNCDEKSFIELVQFFDVKTLIQIETLELYPGLMKWAQKNYPELIALPKEYLYSLLPGLIKDRISEGTLHG